MILTPDPQLCGALEADNHPIIGPQRHSEGEHSHRDEDNHDPCC